jgi:hypothetical protein
MSNTGLAFHAHTYAIALETHNSTPSFNKFFKVIATDTLIRLEGNIEFIVAMEAYHYPIYSTMFHPEYQLLDVIPEYGFKIHKSPETEEIAHNFSKLMFHVARKSPNRFKSQKELFALLLDNAELGPFPINPPFYMKARGTYKV